MTKLNTRHMKALAVMLTLISAVAAQAREESPHGYVMTVYQDSSYGSALVDGSYDSVISKLESRGRAGSSELTRQVSLCVAYAKTKQMNKAITACDLAIAASENSLRLRTGDELDFDRAVALSNRGVLHAIEGDADLAKSMFEMAIELKSDLKPSKTNLKILQKALAEQGS